MDNATKKTKAQIRQEQYEEHVQKMMKDNPDIPEELIREQAKSFQDPPDQSEILDDYSDDIQDDSPLDMDMSDEDFFKLHETKVRRHGDKERTLILNKKPEYHYHLTLKEKMLNRMRIGYRKVPKPKGSRDTYMPYADPEAIDIEYADYILMYTSKKLWMQRQLDAVRADHIQRGMAIKNLERQTKKLFSKNIKADQGVEDDKHTIR